MPEISLRGRFQIHLSTAVVMMFVAGGIIWANIRPTKSRYAVQSIQTGKIWFNEFDSSDVRGDVRNVFPAYGWPFTAVQSLAFDEGISQNYDYSAQSYYTNYTKAALDLALSFMILFVVWFLCEWLIRRRAARKGA